MILHRLLITVVMLVLMHYLCFTLGWQQLEWRMQQIGWYGERLRGATPFTLYFFTVAGWATVVFSYVWGNWLGKPHDYRASSYAIGGWLCLLIPSAGMLYAGCKI